MIGQPFGIPPPTAIVPAVYTLTQRNEFLEFRSPEAKSDSICHCRFSLDTGLV